MKKTLLNLGAKYPTPFLVYNEQDLINSFNLMHDSFTKVGCKHQIYYAIKSCYVHKVAESLFKLGAGVEVMTHMELNLVTSMSIKPNGIILGGIGRSLELLQEVSNKSGIIIIDSINDFYKIKYISDNLKTKVNIGIRIRPDLSCLPKLINEHFPYADKCIKLGLVPFSEEFNKIIEEIKNSDYLILKVIHAHFSINVKESYIATFVLDKIKDFCNQIQHFDFFKNIEVIDIGGGFGTFSTSEYQKAQKMFKEIGIHFLKLFPNFSLYLEPGRYLSNGSGYVVSKVLDIKEDRDITFIFIDASTNVLIPIPTSSYKIFYPEQVKKKLGYKITITDGITSPNNIIISNIYLSNKPKVGDLIILGNCGAYTSVLQHFWGYEPYNVYFLDKQNNLSEIISSYDISAAKKAILKI